MKTINKYLQDIKIDGLSAKLLSYSAMATAFVVSGPDANAQCTGESAMIGESIGLDIDGDGVDDVLIRAGNTSYPLGARTQTTPIGNVASVGTVQVTTMATAMFTATNIPGFPYNGCYLFSLGTGALAGPATLIIPSFTATATAVATGVVNYTNAFYQTNFTTNINVNYAFVTAAGANQIVGLSATGSGVCTLIDSASGVSGTGTSSLVGYSATIFYNSIRGALGGVQYDFPSVSATAMNVATFAYGPAPSCTTTMGGIAPGIQFTISTIATATLAPVPDVTNAGPYLLAGPASYQNTAMLSNNPITQVAVQFESGGETYNGWVSLTYGADGSVTCSGSGYQQCSIETATTAGSAAASCIAVGEATSLSAACIPPVINPELSDPCACGNPNNILEDPDEDPNDVTASVAFFAEIVTIDVPVGGTVVGVTDAGNTGIFDASGAPSNAVFTNNGDTNGDGFEEWTADFFHAPDVGYTLTVSVDIDGVITELSIENSCPQCIDISNIPTVGEWGLIMLGLLMSITAIVGIRQRREEEVTA